MDELIDALKAEEQLVTPEHSIEATEQWDQAAFAIRAAERKAGGARDAYKTRCAGRTTDSKDHLAAGSA